MAQGASGGIINITTNLRSMNKLKKTISSEWNSDGYRLNFNYGEKINDKLTTEIGYFKQDRDLYFKDTYKNSEYFSAGVQYNAGRGQRAKILVGLDGSVESVEILNSVPNLGFKESAIQALRKMQFAPIYYQSHNVKMDFTKRIYFQP
jgi:TonB family protein